MFGEAENTIQLPHHSNLYITDKNVPVVLLVNATSRDIKCYAYIPNIWREGKKFLYKMDISLVLRDIVGILLISPMPTLIMWLPWRLLVLVFHRQWPKTLDVNCIKLRILGSNWLVMVTLKCCWTMLMIQTPINWSNALSLSFRSLPVIIQLRLSN